MKKSLIGLVAIGLSFASCASFAGLTLFNNTNEDSTSIINNSMCSNKLAGGITKAHTRNDVSDKTIKIACLGNPSNCKADVYMSTDCTGPVVANIVFDVSTGVKSVTMTSPLYQISAQGFTVSMDYA